MIEIAPGKWGYFDQIIFNANKTAFESFFAFPMLHYFIKSYCTQALDIGRLHPKQDIPIINKKLETKSTRRSSLFWLSYFGLHLRP